MKSHLYQNLVSISICGIIAWVISLLLLHLFKRFPDNKFKKTVSKYLVNNNSNDRLFILIFVILLRFNKILSIQTLILCSIIFYYNNSIGNYVEKL